MLSLRDFFHLPQLDPWIDQMIADPSGLLVLAGLDPRPGVEPRSIAEPRPDAATARGYLPSGRQTLFGLLLDSILSRHADKKCIVVSAEKHLVRVPRQFRRRVRLDVVNASHDYADLIPAAAAGRPGLLVIDHLSGQTLLPALAAARQGVPVLSQLDTVFRGEQVVRQLLEMGATWDDVDVLRWILAVQRLPALCPHCKKAASPDAAQLQRLRRYQDEAAGAGVTFYRSPGCSKCRDTGRAGDLALFDVFRLEDAPANQGSTPSLLPMETYVWELVRAGHLPLEDFLEFEPDQFRRTFNLFVDRERALVETKAALESQLVQLEAAHKVLQQRTAALISLQAIGQVMIASTDLEDLAARLCRHAIQLCGAERAILYYQRSPGDVEVLAVAGWDPLLLNRRVDMDEILAAGVGPQPLAFNRRPPGLPAVLLEENALRAGMAVSLYAQNEWLGLMILHASQKDGFLPGEVAMLQTFANQAALAIQRAGLVEQLRGKIEQLEAAQVELASKERLERELELARQVQQSLLPRTFPRLPGFHFAVRCEPARQVGGDFYDVMPLSNGLFGVAIADVSDKGMPAALYMALSRSLLLAVAQRTPSPGFALSEVNRLLLELGGPDGFVSMFYGVVDPQSRRLTFARGGHERPYLLREGELLPLDADGAVLGLLDAAEFRLQEQQVRLSPGDKLVLYTDGLTDVLNPEGQLSQRKKLEGLLRSGSHDSPAALIDRVFAALANFRGAAEQYDDMTMLVVEVV